MNKKNITLMVVAVLTLITFVGLATYAYFAGTGSITNKANVTATTERNNLVFDTNGGAMQLDVSASSMQRSQADTVAAQNSATLTVNLTANTDYSMVCTYDIVYEWTSNDKYTAHSSGVSSNEFTIKASLASNSHTYEGTNNIANETDLSSLTYTNNSATVVSGAQIDATGDTMSTAVWTFESKIYNANANQTNLVNKNFGGRFKVANVSCVAGESRKSIGTSYWAAIDHRYSIGRAPDIRYQDNIEDQNVYYAEEDLTSLTYNHRVFIKSEDDKHAVCVTIGDKIICLTQPVSQYYDYFDNGEIIVDENNEPNYDLGNYFEENGIAVQDGNNYYCSSDTIGSGCDFSRLYGVACIVGKTGLVACADAQTFADTQTLDYCFIHNDGSGECKKLMPC